MKVALVCDWYRPRIGGIELHLQDLAARLSAAGHEIIVITPTPGPDVVDGIRVVRIRAPLAPGFGFLVTPGGVDAIAQALRAEQPDVAHCHVSIVSPAAIGGAFAASLQKIPTAVTFHSVVPQMRLVSGAANLLFGISELVASFSAVSERVARETRVLAGRRRMSVVPNGIDVAFWRAAARNGAARNGAARSARDTDGDQCRVVSVMRLNAKKRPFALVDVMQQVAATLATLGAGRRVTLRVIGDGPLSDRLATAVSHAGLDDRVQLLGRQSREQIRDVFATSDVFLLPTVRESFGLAALEARCAGLPVIAMAASGVAEFIRHDQEGLLARNDSELAAHVATLARDSARLDRISAHNRQTVPPHDWPRVVAANLALYEEAISLRRSV